MESLNLYTCDLDKCFYSSTDFEAVQLEKILNCKLAADGYTMQCLMGVPAFSLLHLQ